MAIASAAENDVEADDIEVELFGYDVWLELTRGAVKLEANVQLTNPEADAASVLLKGPLGPLEAKIWVNRPLYNGKISDFPNF